MKIKVLFRNGTIKQILTGPVNEADQWNTENEKKTTIHLKYAYTRLY